MGWGLCPTGWSLCASENLPLLAFVLLSSQGHVKGDLLEPQWTSWAARDTNAYSLEGDMLRFTQLFICQDSNLKIRAWLSQSTAKICDRMSPMPQSWHPAQRRGRAS